MSTSINEHQRGLLKQWLARCNPNEPIGVLDERYCDFTAHDGNAPVLLRGTDAMVPLADCICLSEQSCQLFSGYSGNGKSTELKRLAHQLRQNGYTVLLADAENYHDLEHAIVPSELLVIIAAAFGEHAAKALDSKALDSKAPTPSYWKRFAEFLKTEVQLSELKVGAGEAELKLALRHATPFWLEIRHSLDSRLAQLKENAHAYIRECLALLKRLDACNGVVFILDSMEKLSGPVTSLQVVLESVAQVFSQHADLLRLPGCHVIYTVPPHVSLLAQNMVRLYDGPLHVLPSLKVLQRGEEPRAFEPGVRVMLELLGKRIPLNQVFSEPRLAEELILASGGHVRTLIMLVRDLLISAASKGLPATEGHVQEVIQRLREQLELSIRPEAVPILDEIRRTSSVKGVKSGDLPLLARHMNAQLVLCYRNGEGWYEVHPLVREDVQIRAQQIAADPARQSSESR
jgi:hypothetical protein